MRLSPKQRRLLRAWIRVRREGATKKLCKRFTISARTVAREEAAMLYEDQSLDLGQEAALLDDLQCLNLGHSRKSRRVRVSIKSIKEPTT